MIAHEMVIFNNIRTDILKYKKKVNLNRIKDFLNESEMNAY